MITRRYETRSILNTTPKLPVWSTRLKAARENRGLSQRTLGIAAGLDAGVASTRINRYELGVHAPDYNISRKIASALDVPVAYLYCDDDFLAQCILAINCANESKKQEIANMLNIP